MRIFCFVFMLMVSLDTQATSQCTTSSKICTSGPATVLIDGMEVTRECWANTMTYACLEDATASSCDSAVARGCTVIKTTCQESATINGVSQCVTEQREYSCKVADAATSNTVDCGAQQFCVEGNCFDTGSVPDPDFTKAVTSMEAAREAGVYVDESTFQLFKGQDNRCSTSVLSNCCKGGSSPVDGLSNLSLVRGSAYAFDVLGGAGMKSTLALGFDPTSFALSIAVMVVQQMLQCDNEEKLLMVKRSHQLCHYVGNYCSKKVGLGFASLCVQRKETYCCFNSKMAEILNTAAHTQFPSLTWGSPENPRCEGMSVAQFQGLDFAAIDFSDFYNDIKPKAIDENGVLTRAAGKVDSYFSR